MLPSAQLHFYAVLNMFLGWCIVLRSAALHCFIVVLSGEVVLGNASVVWLKVLTIDNASNAGTSFDLWGFHGHQRNESWISPPPPKAFLDPDSVDQNINPKNPLTPKPLSPRPETP